MTYGEQSELICLFLEKCKESDNPEEDLARDNMIASFTESLSENKLNEFRQVYEKLKTDERLKDKKSLQIFENCIYEDVLELKTDVRTEYVFLKDQVADLFHLIRSRQLQLESKLSAISDKKSSEYQRVQDLIGQTRKIEKEAGVQSKTSGLIRLAISNSRNAF